MENCDQCEKYKNKNFCGNCGRCLASGINKNKVIMHNFYININRIKREIRWRFVDMPYLVLIQKYKIFSEEHGILSSLVPTSLEKVREIYDDSWEKFNYRDDIAYARAFESIFDTFDHFLNMNMNIFIIDITELEVKKSIEIDSDEMILRIKNVEVYTEEEFKEKFPPPIKDESNWIDTYFVYRKDIYYYNSRSSYSYFEPFIREKVYIISSGYSKIIGEYLKKMGSDLPKKEVNDISGFSYLQN